MFTWGELWEILGMQGEPPENPDEPSSAEETATPMRFANILRLNDLGERELIKMRWGFPDRKDAAPTRPKHMHARGETVDRLPTFAECFALRRGILPVRTFNEGKELPNGKTEQWTITPKDGKPIGIAVIYEEWINGSDSLLLFVQVTTPANELISQITDRMPAIIEPDDWPLWLGEDHAPLEEVKALLQTYDDKGNWTMEPERKTKRPPPPKPPKPPNPQSDLF